MTPALGIALILALVALAYFVRRRFFPAPVPWSSEHELAAMSVARAYGVTIQEARLLVVEWLA